MVTPLAGGAVDRGALLLEAARRGLLRPEMKARLAAEAQRRGIARPAQPEAPPIAEPEPVYEPESAPAPEPPQYESPEEQRLTRRIMGIDFERAREDPKHPWHTRTSAERFAYARGKARELVARGQTETHTEPQPTMGERMADELGPFTAGVSGALSGVTLGIAPFALRTTGVIDDDAAEALRISRERHPIASTAGSFAGAAAPVGLIAGGAGKLAGAGGAAAGLGQTGRLVARGVGEYVGGEAAIGTQAGLEAAGEGQDPLRAAMGATALDTPRVIGKLVMGQQLEPEEIQQLVMSLGGAAVAGLDAARPTKAPAPQQGDSASGYSPKYNRQRIVQALQTYDGPTTRLEYGRDVFELRDGHVWMNNVAVAPIRRAPDAPTVDHGPVEQQERASRGGYFPEPGEDAVPLTDDAPSLEELRAWRDQQTLDARIARASETSKSRPTYEDELAQREPAYPDPSEAATRALNQRYADSQAAKRDAWSREHLETPSPERTDQMIRGMLGEREEVGDIPSADPDLADVRREVESPQDAPEPTVDERRAAFMRRRKEARRKLTDSEGSKYLEQNQKPFGDRLNLPYPNQMSRDARRRLFGDQNKKSPPTDEPPPPPPAPPERPPYQPNPNAEPADSANKPPVALAEGDRRARSPSVRSMPVSELLADPERFQYKRLGSSGVSEELKGVTRFDPNKSGVLLVWRDPEDGNTYVVNGHHRLDLAKRLGEENVDVKFIEAGDAREARRIGAMVNIAEGRGTAIDAAKIMRDEGITAAGLEREGVSLRGKVASDGEALSKLSPSLFQRVINEQMPVERAVAIGRGLEDHAAQEALVKLLDSRKGEVNAKVLDELIRQAESVGSHVESQASLFGIEHVKKNHLIERARVAAALRQRISRRKRLFSTVASEGAASDLSEAGNVIDVGRSGETAQAASEAEFWFDRLANSKGPVADMLNRAASEVATKKGSPDAIAKQIESDVIAILDNEGRARGGGSPPTRGGGGKEDGPTGGADEGDSGDAGVPATGKPKKPKPSQPKVKKAEDTYQPPDRATEEAEAAEFDRLRNEGSRDEPPDSPDVDDAWESQFDRKNKKEPKPKETPTPGKHIGEQGSLIEGDRHVLPGRQKQGSLMDVKPEPPPERHPLDLPVIPDSEGQMMFVMGFVGGNDPISRMMSWIGDRMSAAAKSGEHEVENVREFMSSAKSFWRTAFRTSSGALISSKSKAAQRLGKDIKRVDITTRRLENRDTKSIAGVINKYTEDERIEGAKYADGLIKNASQRAKDYAEEAQGVMDRIPNLLIANGMQRRLPSGKMAPLALSQRWYPHVLNARGRAWFRELLEKGMASPVVSPTITRIANRLGKSPDEIVKSLVEWRKAHITAGNAYLQRSRKLTPEQIEDLQDFFEWDGSKTLPGQIRRNSVTAASFLTWGQDDVAVKHLLERMRFDGEGSLASSTKRFLEATLANDTDTIPGSAQIANAIGKFQAATKMSSPLTSLRNMGQRWGNTIIHEPGVTLRATKAYPPFFNRWMKSAKKLSEEAERAGIAKTGTEITDIEVSHDAGFGITRKLLAGQRLTEAGNNDFAAITQKFALESALSRLKNAKAWQKTRTGKVIESVLSFSGLRDPLSSVERKMARVGIDAASLNRAVSRGKFTPKEVADAMVMFADQTQFANTMSNQPLWWRRSPWLRRLFQFKTFGARQIGLIWDHVAKEAANGNMGPSVRFLGAMIITGELYQTVSDILSGKDRSIISGLFNDREEDARDWATRTLNSFKQGGGIGLVADVVFGMENFLGGPTYATLKNVAEAALTVSKSPRVAPEAIWEATKKEAPIIRQSTEAKRLISRTVFDDGDGGRKGFDSLRTDARRFDDKTDGRTLLDKIVRGQKDFDTTEKTAPLRYAARSVSDGNERDAAMYLAEAMRSEPDLKKAVESIRASMRLQSPLGPLSERERAEYLRGLPMDQRRDAVKKHAEWIRRYNKALSEALQRVSAKRKKAAA